MCCDEMTQIPSVYVMNDVGLTVQTMENVTLCAVAFPHDGFACCVFTSFDMRHWSFLLILLSPSLAQMCPVSLVPWV